MMRADFPEISVVMPVFNGEDFIEEAIQSVVIQSFLDWELIIIDNYSTDNTKSIIDTFRDGRIKYLQFRNNGVIASSRNFGISQSQGEFIAFLDADDFWYPNKLEVCMKELHAGFDLVSHSEYWFWENGKRKLVHYPSGRRLQYRSLLMKGNGISTSSVIVKKDALRSVSFFSDNPEYVTVEDYDLWLRLARENYKFENIRLALGEYRIHSNSAIRQQDQYDHAIAEVLVSHFEAKDWKLWSFYAARRRLALAVAESGRASFESGNPGDAWKKFREAISISPFSWRVWVLLLLSLPSVILQ